MAVLTPHTALRGMRNLGCVILLLCTGYPAQADPTPRELKVEAAYLYNFFNYITFPKFRTPEQKKRATLCIQGRAALLPYLEYIRQHKQQERILTIRSEPNKNELAGCDILYFGPDATKLDRSLLRAARQYPTLIIGMRPNFLNNGGMIELTHQQERIAMAVNKHLMDEKGFSVSSRLLVLAQEIKK